MCYTADMEGMDDSFNTAVKTYDNVDENSILVIISYFKRALISGIIVNDKCTTFTVTLRDNQMPTDMKFTVAFKSGKEKDCFKTHFLDEMVNVGFLEEKQIQEKKEFIADSYNMFSFSEAIFEGMLNDIMRKYKMKPFDMNCNNHNACIMMTGYDKRDNGLFVLYNVFVKNKRVECLKSEFSSIIDLEENLAKEVDALNEAGYLKKSEVNDEIIEATYNILSKRTFDEVFVEVQKLYESKN
jgi:hypothetical protein